MLWQPNPESEREAPKYMVANSSVLLLPIQWDTIGKGQKAKQLPHLCLFPFKDMHFPNESQKLLA